MFKRLGFSRRFKNNNNFRYSKRYKRYISFRFVRFSAHFKRFHPQRSKPFVKLSSKYVKLKTNRFPFLFRSRIKRRAYSFYRFSKSYKLSRPYKSRFVYRITKKLRVSFFKFNEHYQPIRFRTTFTPRFTRQKFKFRRKLFKYRKFKSGRRFLKFKFHFKRRPKIFQSYSFLVFKKQYFRRKTLGYFSKRNAKSASRKKLRSLLSAWSPVFVFKRAKKSGAKLRANRQKFGQFLTIPSAQKRVVTIKNFLIRARRGLRRAHFAKLTQTYNNFFLQVGNFVSQRIYFTFTAGRVPVLRRNRRKTTQTLVEASTFFSKKLIRLKIKKLQLWVVGPISYFVRKFVKTLKKHRLRITNVSHFLRYSHNGLRSRSLRRV